MLSMENPIFQVYVIAASLLILKYLLHGWLTVVRMIRINGGMLNPEDLNKTISNPNPNPAQLDVNEYVERTRRMHRNELENVPPFLVAGLLFVAVNPALWLAQLLCYGFVIARLLHFFAYATAKPHEVRALFFSAGSLITMFMAAYVLISAVG